MTKERKDVMFLGHESDCEGSAYVGRSEKVGMKTRFEVDRRNMRLKGIPAILIDGYIPPDTRKQQFEWGKQMPAGVKQSSVPGTVPCPGSQAHLQGMAGM